MAGSKRKHEPNSGVAENAEPPSKSFLFGEEYPCLEYLAPPVRVSLEAAVLNKEWETAAKLLGEWFSVAHPTGSSLAELKKFYRDNPATKPWVDPRVLDGWTAMPPAEQWSALEGFINKCVTRIGVVSREWARNSLARHGIIMSLARDGMLGAKEESKYWSEMRSYSFPHLQLSKSSEPIFVGALEDVLGNMLMRFGTLEIIDGPDRQPWVILLEILESGVGAVCHALSITTILKQVTAAVADRL